MEARTILETPRLVLREFTLYDTDFIVRLLNSPGWLAFIGDRNVRTESQATDYLLNGPLKSYHENGFGLWMAALKENQAPVGMCGLLKRDYLEFPDIGFAFLPEHLKLGYAFEIAAATLHHAKEFLHLPTIMAMTVSNNQASIRLLERLGLKFLRTIPSPGTNDTLKLFQGDI